MRSTAPINSKSSEIQLNEFIVTAKECSHPRFPKLCFVSEHFGSQEIIKRAHYLLNMVAKHPEALTILEQAAELGLTVEFKPFKSIVSHASCSHNEYGESKHTIQMNYASKNEEMLNLFIFELCNTRRKYPSIRNMPLGKLLRLYPTAEDYGKAFETIEFNTQQEAAFLMQKGVQLHGWPKSANRPFVTNLEDYLQIVKKRSAYYHGISHIEINYKNYYEELSIALHNELHSVETNTPIPWSDEPFKKIINPETQSICISVLKLMLKLVTKTLESLESISKTMEFSEVSTELEAKESLEDSSTPETKDHKEPEVAASASTSKESSASASVVTKTASNDTEPLKLSDPSAVNTPSAFFVSTSLPAATPSSPQTAPGSLPAPTLIRKR